MDEPRTGAALFVCRCGPNIADFLDLDEVVAWAQQRDDIGKLADFCDAGLFRAKSDQPDRIYLLL